MNFSTTIETEEDILEVEVEFNYQKGEPEVYQYSNGDPGHPGCGPEVELVSIICDNLEMVDVLEEKYLKQLTDEAFEFMADYDTNNY